MPRTLSLRNLTPLACLLGAFIAAPSQAQTVAGTRYNTVTKTIKNPFVDAAGQENKLRISIGGYKSSTFVCYEDLVTGASKLLEAAPEDRCVYEKVPVCTINRFEIYGGAKSDVFVYPAGDYACGIFMDYPIHDGAIFGGAGSDSMQGYHDGSSSIVAWGGTGNDNLRASPYSNRAVGLHGEDGADKVTGGVYSSDKLYGGAGNDCLDDAANGTSFLTCGSGTGDFQTLRSYGNSLGEGCEAIWQDTTCGNF